MHQRRLFVGCIIALVATAFAFVVRAQVLDQWGVEFKLTETEKGKISGAGMFPFVITIIGFSLLVDTIGYGTVAVIAFILHVTSTLLLIFAKDPNWLYYGCYAAALANGTVEAFINPITATLYPKEKTHYLNILHAGWPGGMAIEGLLALGLGYASRAEWIGTIDWRVQVGLTLIPTAIYGAMLFGQKFPVNERVTAGVPYGDMVKEFFHPIFLFLVVIMIPLATTELGTDSWITDMMKPIFGAEAGFVLVYTSVIMFVLRFFAGPIVHVISPLGLLAVSAAIACAGLYSLSVATTGAMIFAAATLYGIGKTFFWPTTLGVISERFPKGGALTLNGVSGIGMLTAGLLGIPFIGTIQDTYIDSTLKEKSPAIYAQVTKSQKETSPGVSELVDMETKTSLLGDYKGVDATQVSKLSESDKKVVTDIQDASKRYALSRVAIFPAIMLVCYILLILYYKSQGGYKAELLDTEEGERMAGGVPGPVV